MTARLKVIEAERNVANAIRVATRAKETLTLIEVWTGEPAAAATAHPSDGKSTQAEDKASANHMSVDAYQSLMSTNNAVNTASAFNAPKRS
jgi:hypothetical protein